MGVEAPIELGRQLLPLEELTLNVYFRVALHFGDRATLWMPSATC